jgi:hypothetical protein
MSKEALKLALEALQTLHDENMDYLVRNKLGGENNQCMVFARDVIKSIKRTLAQPEQEPVGYFNANSDGKWEQSDSNDGVPFYAALPPQPKEPEQEPLEYWNAVEGWVKIDEVREHFDSVGCGTIYKTSGEGRVPLSLWKAQPEQKPAYSSCFRCVTPKKCSVYGCCPNTWPSENATPPQRKPLTDEQILADETLRYYFGLNGGAGPVSKQGRKIVNAIEAFHNIKEIEK